MRSPLEILKLSAKQAYDYNYAVWRFGEGIAMEGLLAAFDVTGDKTYFNFVRSTIQSWMVKRDKLIPEDHTAAGTALVRLWRTTQDQHLLHRANQLADLLLNAPVHSSGVRLHVKDGTDWKSFAWVDCMHTDAPFLANLGQATSNETYMDGAANLLLTQIRAFQDPASGLFSHGFDGNLGSAEGVHWGRGNGWALLGLVETLEALPKSHTDYAVIHESLVRLASALAAHQTPDGQFRTVIDEVDAPVEYSVAAFVAAGLHRGRRLGLLSENVTAAANQAWAAVEKAVQADGCLEVSIATAASPEISWYCTRPTSHNVPWGQGPVLLAAVEQLFHEKEEIAGEHRTQNQ